MIIIYTLIKLGFQWIIFQIGVIIISQKYKQKKKLKRLLKQLYLGIPQFLVEDNMQQRIKGGWVGFVRKHLKLKIIF